MFTSTTRICRSTSARTKPTLGYTNRCEPQNPNADADYIRNAVRKQSRIFRASARLTRSSSSSTTATSHDLLSASSSSLPTMPTHQLTAGICSRLNETEHSEELLSSKPIVQILSVKRVGSTAGPNPIDRYRIIVSDGEHFLQSMLATQLNHFVDDGQIIKNTICRLDKFTCNLVQEKRYDLLSSEL